MAVPHLSPPGTAACLHCLTSCAVSFSSRGWTSKFCLCRPGTPGHSARLSLTFLDYTLHHMPTGAMLPLPRNTAFTAQPALAAAAASLHRGAVRMRPLPAPANFGTSSPGVLPCLVDLLWVCSAVYTWRALASPYAFHYPRPMYSLVHATCFSTKRYAKILRINSSADSRFLRNTPSCSGGSWTDGHSNVSLRITL